MGWVHTLFRIENLSITSKFDLLQRLNEYKQINENKFCQLDFFKPEDENFQVATLQFYILSTYGDSSLSIYCSKVPSTRWA